MDFEGVIATSSSTLPAPAVSALNLDYVNEMGRVAKALNGMSVGQDSIGVAQFQGIAAFAEAMSNLERQVSA